MRGQGLQAVQDLADVVLAAVDDLQGADAVVGVLNTLSQLGFRVAIAVGDGQTGRIVTGRVDAIARGQPLNRATLEVRVHAQVVLSDERGNVGLNGKHCKFLFCWPPASVPVRFSVDSDT